MHKQIAEMWTSALRSGEYAQGGFVLLNKNQFCCLAVLCDIHSKQTGNSWCDVEESEEKTYLGESNFLPREVMEWAGMNSICGEVSGTNLAYLNDEKSFSFNSIADLIDENWESL